MIFSFLVFGFKQLIISGILYGTITSPGTASRNVGAAILCRCPLVRQSLWLLARKLPNISQAELDVLNDFPDIL